MDLFLKIGPLKTFILQPLRNAHHPDSGGCKMKVFNGSGFTPLKCKTRINEKHLLYSHIRQDPLPQFLRHKADRIIQAFRAEYDIRW
jgi:hypothetical protein